MNGLNSGKVARNTILLYVRMLVLMVIGLFTSRIVLKCLGVDDYGTYNVVYSLVMMFTVISGSVSGAVNRFLAYELGKEDGKRLKKAFSSAVLIQIACSLLLILIGETLGIWYLRNHVDIPAGRETAAMWVFQCSVFLLVVQLFSIPFNCAIIAHEDMKAFAWISILEGVLKLAVAFALYAFPADKLKVYAVLMVAVSLAVRSAYALYCRKHYEETSGGLVLDRDVVRSMLSMSAWSATAYGVGAFNTQGVNLLSNAAFGVRINAARGIASQIENIVRQLVSNLLTALNPQITKSWASDDRQYCFSIVRKGCKFSYLIVLLFAIPFLFEADYLLDLWLEEVPESASLFTKLAIFCVMCDMMSNSLGQLIMAEGRVGMYYSLLSVISSLSFTGSWIAFSHGFPAHYSYCISITVFCLIAFMRLNLAGKRGFPLKPFIREVLLPLIAVTVLSSALSYIPYRLLEGKEPWRLIATASTGVISICALSFILVLTGGERNYLKKVLRGARDRA
ncbi:MAG: oligosaccharide flippase family protein [Bacteroidales bacterium]|nr:oligosaccharide flippase family protein [Bacteroidales bacterium]